LATVDFADRTITLNLAWFGPTQSGCGTNVRQLHRLLRAREKTDLRRVGGGKDRTERSWHFSCQPEDLPRIDGFEIRVQLRSVPGGDSVGLDRDTLLRGVDGVAFVADARAHRASANLDAILDLERVLVRHGLHLADLPLVFQVNQTDAANARPPARVLEDLDPFGMPSVEAMARQGQGVKETWDTLLSAALARLRDNLPASRADLSLTAVFRADREGASAVVSRHVGALPADADAAALSSVLPPVAEIMLRPPDLKGQMPIRHVRSTMQGNALRVEAIFRKADGDLRKLALLIESPTTARPEPGTMGPSTGSGRRPEPSAPSRLLPRPLTALDDAPGELPRLTYGVVGTIAGLISGLSLGYLLFV